MTGSDPTRGDDAWVGKGDTPAALLDQGVYVPEPQASLEERLGRELAAAESAAGPALRRVTEDPELLARVVQRLQVEVRRRRATGMVTVEGLDAAFAAPVAIRLGLPLQVVPREEGEPGGEGRESPAVGRRPVAVLAVLGQEPDGEGRIPRLLRRPGHGLQAAVAVLRILPSPAGERASRPSGSSAAVAGEPESGRHGGGGPEGLPEVVAIRDVPGPREVHRDRKREKR